MAYRILVINPGSTTTKIAVYEDDKALFTKNVDHDATKIAEFASIPEQAPFRTEYISKALVEQGIEESTLDCVMCRGGLLMEPPIKSGGYVVNEDLCVALADENLTSPHASLLGGLIGKQFSDKLGIPAYIYDAVSSGELPEVAMVTGFKEIKRRSFAHVLNGRAMAIKHATSVGKKVEDLNIIVAHMGGGCSVAAYKGGVLIDSVGDDELHMSAERAGGAPLLMFNKLCFSGKYNAGDVKKLIRGKGGLMAHLGTSDGREIENRGDAGDKDALFFMEALSYGLSKSIGSVSIAFEGNTDAIILTGGLAYCKYITDSIAKYTKAIAPTVVLPGESEMLALAQGGVRLLKGEEEAGVYALPEGYNK